ncbi:FIVAR domain-containing protein [Clostridium sp. MSJ-4]|uniref:FIVAR domain-containing protein n=1 Tax=Clostridium simiarum TaxID=2841506 RepID=A0ABS6F3N9_9CLOT|nr:FIVAR domain-containing protein [Clostridium simiarum]MBU5592490.1 FIVAR domain-containing protein [Clostridium simiarum]
MRDSEVIINKTALTEAITVANTAKNITVDTDEANVEEGTKWVTAGEKQAYVDAIALAQEIADKADATQEDVNDAISKLATATSTFKAAQKDGTKKAVIVVDKTALTEAIIAANTAKNITVDTDEANVEEGTKWVTAGEKQAYVDAIALAQEIADKADATQEDVNDAVSKLATATVTFQTAQKDGTKQP